MVRNWNQYENIIRYSSPLLVNIFLLVEIVQPKRGEKMRICFLLLVLTIHNAMANSCNIEEGFYTIKVKDERTVKVDSCVFESPTWGANFFYRALFNKEDKARAKRDLRRKHESLIETQCKLLGSGIVEVTSYKGECTTSTDKEAVAIFTINYKCDLY